MMVLKLPKTTKVVIGKTYKNQTIFNSYEDIHHKNVTLQVIKQSTYDDYIKSCRDFGIPNCQPDDGKSNYWLVSMD